MRALAALLVLLVLLVVSGAAIAGTLSTTAPFALTRSGDVGYQVSWQTNVTIEASVITVNATHLNLDGTRMDFAPDGLQKIRVYITQWSLDKRTFRVVMTAGERTGLAVTYTNPGQSLSVYEAGELTKTCAAVVSPCRWTFTNATDFTFSVLTPIGVQAQAGDPPSQPLSASGGSGSSPAPAPAEARPIIPTEIPTPDEVFPRFTTWRWAAFVAGLALTMNGFAATRGFLPISVPAPPMLSAFLGAVTLALVYLTPI